MNKLQAAKQLRARLTRDHNALAQKQKNEYAKSKAKVTQAGQEIARLAREISHRAMRE